MVKKDSGWIYSLSHTSDSNNLIVSLALSHSIFLNGCLISNCEQKGELQRHIFCWKLSPAHQNWQRWSTNHPGPVSPALHRWWQLSPHLLPLSCPKQPALPLHGTAPRPTTSQSQGCSDQDLKGHNSLIILCSSIWVPFAAYNQPSSCLKNLQALNWYL